MSKSSTIALAVGAGYVLGRKHKLRMAALLAAAAATGSAGGMAGRALRSGGKLLASPQVLDKLPPEAAKIAGLVRSDLAQAGKAAAQAAVSSRIDGLTSSLYERADAVRGGGMAKDEPARNDLPEDDADDGAEVDQGEPEDDEREVRPRASAPRRPAGKQSGSRSGDRPEPRRRAAPEGREENRGRGRKARTRTGSAPVRRTGR